MGKERESKYYDIMYGEAPIRQQHWQAQPWYKLWMAAAEACMRLGQPILDLGCGQGHLVGCLLQFSHGQMGEESFNYKGYDFSPRAIKMAATLYGTLEEVEFYQHDLRYGLPLRDGATYVFCEVLEHITEDLTILGQVPQGADVILTLPSKDDPSHVRFFPTMGEALLRYLPLLDVTEARTINKKWHYVQGVKR